jgi:hypothetical protein
MQGFVARPRSVIGFFSMDQSFYIVIQRKAKLFKESLDLVVERFRQDGQNVRYDQGIVQHTCKAAPFDITGRVMKGWGTIPKTNLRSKVQYKSWIQRGLAFARSLPAK